MEYNKHFDIENAIEDSKFQLDQQFAGVEIIKNNARDTFSSLSLIVALLGVVKISDMSMNFYSPSARECFLLLAGLSYLGMAYINMILLQPIGMRTAVRVDRDYLPKLYENKSPKEILTIKLNHYLDAVKENRETLENKMKISKVMGYLYFGVIILLLVAILLP